LAKHQANPARVTASQSISAVQQLTK